MNKVAILAAMLFFFSVPAFAQTDPTDPPTEPEVTVTETDAQQISLVKENTGKTLYGSTADAADSTSPLIGKTSTGVGLGIATGPVGYALTTQHLSGTKAFGSRHDSTSIFTKDATAVGTPVGAEITVDFDFEGDGWKSL